MWTYFDRYPIPPLYIFCYQGHGDADNLHYAAVSVKLPNRSRRPRNNTSNECVYSSVKLQTWTCFMSTLSSKIDFTFNANNQYQCEKTCARWKDWWSWPCIVQETIYPHRHVRCNGPSFTFKTSFFLSPLPSK